MCSDTGASATAWGIAAKAIAILQLYEYVKISERQLDLAEKIDARADDLHNIWKEQYLPCELSLLAELCSAPIEVANLELVESRAYADVGRRFAANRTKALYCLPYTAAGARCETNTRFAIEQSKAEAGISQIARNQEIARVELKNTQRQVNIATMLNMGRGGVAVAANMSNSAAAQYQQVASQAASAFNGAMKSIGRLNEQGASNTSGVQNQGAMMTVPTQGVAQYQSQQFQNSISQYESPSSSTYSPAKDAMHSVNSNAFTDFTTPVNINISK
jgi:hypothetical protein